MDLRKYLTFATQYRAREPGADDKTIVNAFIKQERGKKADSSSVINAIARRGSWGVISWENATLNDLPFALQCLVSWA